MARVTSKLQVTIPKVIATEQGIRPGDDLTWETAGDSIRVFKLGARQRSGDSLQTRLDLFDRATERQQQRQSTAKPGRRHRDRGWRREDLYTRGSPD